MAQILKLTDKECTIPKNRREHMSAKDLSKDSHGAKNGGGSL